MNDKNVFAPTGGPTRIFHVRGVNVILDSDLAMALGIETKRLNERVRRNADLVDERHCFVLTADEFSDLRSQNTTSSSDWGGRRHLPRVFTDRGVARVPSFINTPEAHRITDLIIDTFLMVQKQVSAGHQQVVIAEPSRYQVDQEIVQHSRILTRRLIEALHKLVDTVIDIRTHQTVGEVSQDLTARALENLRERLREKGLQNIKLEAETRLILAEAEKIAADVRRANVEIEGIHLDNLNKRIGLVRQLMELQRELEPAQVVQLLDNFERHPGVEKIDIRSPGPALLPRPRGEID